jgi:hypothetical protein
VNAIARLGKKTHTHYVSNPKRKMASRTRGQAAREATQARESLLDTIAALVFAYLPLSVQAITLPALSKAWKRWAQDERAKERALEQAEHAHVFGRVIPMFHVPLWAAQQRQQQQRLSDDAKRRFQLQAARHGDVDAVDWVGVGGTRTCFR